MSKLKYFNKQTYSSLSEALGAIRKELEALQPQDSTDVVWSKSAEGISAKVRNGIIGEESQPVITESDDGDSVTAATYNGMHKLVLITDNSNPDEPTYKVCVCDGATYNPQTHTSKSSRVEVNGVSFDLDSKVFELKKQDQYVYIHFFPGSADATATVEYNIGASIPENYTGKDYYYLIGRAIYTDGTYSITQDHTGRLTNGVVQIWWGRQCNDF